MNKSDIKKIYYNGNEITSLYWGGSLIYSKSNKSDWNPSLLKGKFADDSTESDWKCKLNGAEYVLPVDPETKEFEYEVNYVITDLTNCFEDSKIERIDSFPDTSNVTSMSSMFFGCSSLTSLDLSNFNTENVSNMSSMFYNCSSLTSLDLSNFNTENVTRMSSMFYNCSSLTSLNINYEKKYGGTISHFCIFYGCTSLTTVTGKFNGIFNDFDLKDCPLSNDSAMVFISGLEYADDTLLLYLSQTTYNTLTEEQIALATSKGWSVIRA